MIYSEYMMLKHIGNVYNLWKLKLSLLIKTKILKKA